MDPRGVAAIAGLPCLLGLGPQQQACAVDYGFRQWRFPETRCRIISSRSNPNAMSLADYISETLALFAAGGADEVPVERVKRLRFAESGSNYGAVFGMVNPTA